MRPFSSFSARLITWTLVTAAATFSMLLVLVLLEVSKGLKEQSAEISRWSEERLLQRLGSDAQLARARIDILYEDLATRFASLAQRADVSKAIQSRNSVAISELLAPALKLADLDGALVLDEKLRVLGADRLDADILRADTILQTHPLRKQLDLILEQTEQTSGLLTLKGRFDERLAGLVAAKRSASLAGIFIEPIFDDFRDVSAVIIGYRQLRPQEAKLEEFWRLTNRGVAIVSDGLLVSSAGPSKPQIDQPNSSNLIWVSDGRYVAQCVELWSTANICAIAPSSELQQLATQVIDIGEQRTRSLTRWLVAASALALLVFAVMSLIVSRQMTSPLVKITAVVSDVARGNWRASVPGLKRTDEVGDIARAVLILEKSMQERDQLRSDVVEQNSTLLQKEEVLEEQNLRFDAALNNMSQGLCMFDEAGKLTVSNRRFSEIYQIELSSVLEGSTVEEVFSLTLGATSPQEVFGSELQDHLEFVQTRKSFNYSSQLGDGRTIAISHRPMPKGGWVETHEDVTEQRAAEDKIRHLAKHDALTGLPNRVLFQDRLTEAMISAQHEAFAVLCLDLDDFKAVNDTLGHSAGDELLRQVAKRLLQVIDGVDTVARLGGDEFAIIDRSRDQPHSAQTLAKRVAEAVRAPFDLLGQSVSSGVSIGVAVGSAEVAPDHLLRNADLALYLAKGAGRGTFRLFEPEMHLRMQYRQQLERDLRDALGNGDLEVHFQPMIDLARNEISAFEALVRWHHPLRGSISPAEFIPLAEEVGLIDSLGAWVLRRACLEAASWPDEVKISVNISAVQFRTQGLTQLVQDALEETGLRADRLELEITESVILHEDPETLATLRELREIGVKISMDDFGTGYSSLSGLRSFPFDKIKLDRSFVRDALERPDCAAIVRTVAELGRSLGMRTTAEGVETIEQLENIRRLGYSEAQGFLFSAAVSGPVARQMIEHGGALQRVA